MFPALAIGTLMATLDISIVNVALPTLSRAFRSPLTDVEWVVLAYVTVITGLLLPLGRLADLHGRRRMYTVGLACFTAASALCAAAPGIGWLAAARAVQGVGAAMVTANTAALLISAFPAEERGRVLGIFGAAVGVGLAIGPPLGGLIVSTLSWRWIFLINLPLGLVALELIRRRVPPDPAGRPGGAIDVAGGALGVGALTSLVLGLARGPAAGWGAPSVLGAFAGAVAFALLFAARERHAAAPLIPQELRRGPFARSASLTLTGQGLSMAVGFQLPLYLEDVLGFDAARVGRWLAIMPIAAMALTPVAGRWADRHGPRRLIVAGLLISSGGLGLLAAMGGRHDLAWLLAGMVLFGVGFGLFAIPNASALFGAVPSERLGAASGIQGTMRNLGFTGGSAIAAAFLASRFAAHGGGVLAAGRVAEHARRALIATSREFYVAGAILALLGAWIARGAAAGQPPGESRGAGPE